MGLGLSQGELVGSFSRAVWRSGSLTRPPFSVVVFREGIFPRKTPGREAGGRHTGASQGVECTAAGDRPRGGGPRGSSRGTFRVAGATESLSAGALAGGLEPLLVAGHGTQMPTFSSSPPGRW